MFTTHLELQGSRRHVERFRRAWKGGGFGQIGSCASRMSVTIQRRRPGRLGLPVTVEKREVGYKGIAGWVGEQVKSVIFRSQSRR